jgi:serine/threonine protein kinase
MFSIGSVIDGKYKIAGLCNSTGGMGTILFVNPIAAPATWVVLKYCNQLDDETRNRFRREVRVMQELNGNFYVAPIIDANLEHVPPYFVMPHFEHGDLMNQAAFIRTDLAVAETYFNRMIDCIEQLHTKNVFHRDIKPQNFLVGNGTLVVSDFGLCREHNSSTNFTRASAWAGTPRYMPPEFQNGGFRNADAAGDIYMLGLTFHDILFGNEVPQSGLAQQVAAISVVIERATAYDKNRRYQSLAALRQSLSSAFDMALGRVVGSGGVLGTLQSIVDTWKTFGKSDLVEVSQFIDELSLLPQDDQHRVCLDLPNELFHVLARAPLPPGHLNRFVHIYL